MGSSCTVKSTSTTQRSVPSGSVRALLDQVLIPPNKFAIAEVMDDYTFQLDDYGKVQMLGQDDKAVEFTVEAVTEYLGSSAFRSWA